MAQLTETRIILPSARKKELGAFYTPRHTADYMVSLLSGFKETSKLLEPCGGDGVFVSAVLNKRLLKPSQITVWDIDSGVKPKIERLKVNVEIKDTLLNTNFIEGNLFPKARKLSHVIGNPPYLNKQSSYIKRNKRKLKELYAQIGVNDTYAMFLYLCGNLLEPNGQLSFIISDTYLTLGIHKKLRKWVLDNFTIKEITLCPYALFNDLGASVHTSIITLIKKTPSRNHAVVFNDCRTNFVGDYRGKRYEVIQLDLLKYPDFVFHYENGRGFVDKISAAKNLVDYLQGGLGMHTTDNARFLGVIDYGNGKVSSNGRGVKTIVPLKKMKAGKWRIYHKSGGDVKYYARPKYCIRWDNESRNYYKGFNSNLILGRKRKGFIISGVCSSLSARLMSKGALWESNKAMCFFPKNSNKHPVEFFIGLLNSKLYNNILRIFNHTNSVQIRDIKKLPFFDFSSRDIYRITKLSKYIIEKLKINPDFDFKDYQKKIDNVVKQYAS